MLKNPTKICTSARWCAHAKGEKLTQWPYVRIELIKYLSPFSPFPVYLHCSVYFTIFVPYSRKWQTCCASVSLYHPVVGTCSIMTKQYHMYTVHHSHKAEPQWLFLTTLIYLLSHRTKYWDRLVTTLSLCNWHAIYHNKATETIHIKQYFQQQHCSQHHNTPKHDCFITELQLLLPMLTFIVLH